MKKTTLTFLTLAALCVLAYAGPEAVSSKEIAPAPVVAPPPCFEGFYIGVQGSVAWEPSGSTVIYALGEQYTPVQNPNAGPDIDRDDADDALGGFGGIHVGYNHQIGMWLFGVEMDLSGGSLEASHNAISRRGGAEDEEDEEDGEGSGFGGPSKLGVQAHGDSDLRAFGTLRPRAGIVLGGRFLLFGTGGVVGTWTDSDITEHIRYRFPSDDVVFERIHKSRSRDIDGGWTAGGGIDFCLSEHFLLNFTYLYCDAGDRVPTETHRFFVRGGPDVGPPPQQPGFAVRARSGVVGEIEFHVFQAGLSYKF